ncbi:ribose transport system ATP-binding protein [Pararhizobium capsulatum DSM 1112]|uniref:Ribose transport system ATP-binding protein n=1 Tax=Pararhizobium capsulatum DSM 1112 TaxID=1121113 RepID=A0ABU0BVG2_9HYPH|nr:sugar ABC transporter ATP-binding protein [Pararhizobium capsulatum]MDQ0321699.1 ribose transport system ATP-binding protein [Pararhizobium capsulatum DSM 1112]
MASVKWQETGDIVRLSGIVKTFGGAQALSGASLAVKRGTVHGLVGQNGAGKSTLIKLLAGLHRPDGGEIEIDGVVYAGLSPQQVEHLGIHFIHQDRLLVPTFTVGEALFLGREPRIAGTPFLERKLMRQKSAEILDRYFGLRLPNSALIGELTAAEKQIVQITRALLDEPKVLVFDEPTAALVRREAELLFGLIRRLRDEGITILYISHYLSEIVDLCDTVTVLRNGRDVATLPVKQTSAREIGSLMVNRDIAELYPKPQVSLGKTFLQIEGLGLADRYADVSLSLRQGEVLGLTGLVGSGAKELLRTLFGLESATTGTVTIHGETVFSASPVQATSKRLALVPEDRRRAGVALDLSVTENTTLASLDRFSRAGLLDRGSEKQQARYLIERLQIKTDSADALVRTLSGGNQQKVAIAKWLSRQSEIYLLDEPSVGVDIAAKVEIYTLIGELAARGVGIIVLSSDIDELLGITDRVLVFFRGRIIREFISAETRPDQVLAEVTGANETLRHVG